MFRPNSIWKMLKVKNSVTSDVGFEGAELTHYNFYKILNNFHKELLCIKNCLWKHVKYFDKVVKKNRAVV